MLPWSASLPTRHIRCLLIVDRAKDIIVPPLRELSPFVRGGAHDRDSRRDVPRRRGRAQRGQKEQDQQERADDVDGDGALVAFEHFKFSCCDTRVCDHGIETRKYGCSRGEGLDGGVGREVELPDFGDAGLEGRGFDILLGCFAA